MGDVIKGNFGERSDKTGHNENKIKPEETGEAKKSPEASLSADKLRSISESVGKGNIDGALEKTGISGIDQLRRTLEDIILEGHGLERAKIDLIRGFKPQIPKKHVEKSLQEHKYTKEDAVSLIKNSDEGLIKKKPAFFLSPLMRLELYN